MRRAPVRTARRSSLMGFDGSAAPSDVKLRTAARPSSAAFRAIRPAHLKRLGRVLPTLVAALLAAPAAAQDLGFDPAPAEACMAASLGQPHAPCIGDAGRACMEASGEGETTVVMNGCLSFEAAWWDVRLNEEYKALMEMEARIDGSTVPPPVLSGADALRTMQRAWVAYRDARCAWEATAYGGGTGAGPAFNACNLAETARQALLLAGRRQALENQ